MTTNALAYAELRRMLEQRTAIVLSEEKEYFIDLRMGPLLSRYKVDNLAELLPTLRKDRRAADEAMDAMTINETSFFRDAKPFDVLREVIVPTVFALRGDRPLRVWSAASSTGQEAYSVAMTLLEHPIVRRQGWTYEIVGTDVASSVVERAKAGIYNGAEVRRGLPGALLTRYFEPHDGGTWRAGAQLRAGVRFQVGNLIQDRPPVTDLDLVLLRNVLIYFSEDMRRRVLESVHRAMAPHGVLMLGAGETPDYAADLFERIRLGDMWVYQPRSRR